MNTLETIKNQISTNLVLLYMKGTPQFPMCGFSAKVVHVLGSLNVEYAYVNILENPEIRATLPQYANWPTFPQLYIQGELMGGCDIVTAMHHSGELKPLLEKAGAIKEIPNVVEANPTLNSRVLG